ncbi:MAG: 2-polyprenyl-3-methyl-6-methoxy-1,4-benzoquinone monooxygenase [Janthinobacterium lividum]
MFVDELISGFDKALRVVSGVATATRKNPAIEADFVELDAKEKSHSAGLMRVNHVGEVCAQALYQAQGQFARSSATRHQFAEAAREEEDHLAWTAQRLAELGSRASLLNPLWYAGAYVMGAAAARLGDATSLGFVVETEKQVEAHLAHHLNAMPARDGKSRAVVEQMRADEIAHGNAAQALGATPLPAPVRSIMRAMAKVMTTTAYYL